MENNWVYFGVFLDDVSKEKNLKYLNKIGIKIPNNWKIYNHHMTIAFNNYTEKVQELFNLYQGAFGENVNLTISGIGISDDAIAVRVKYDEPIANKIPHITIATPIDGKPVNSNFITKWIDIEPYTIVGELSCFNRKH